VLRDIGPWSAFSRQILRILRLLIPLQVAYVARPGIVEIVKKAGRQRTANFGIQTVVLMSGAVRDIAQVSELRKQPRLVIYEPSPESS
jgi:hypothetical protein